MLLVIGSLGGLGLDDVLVDSFRLKLVGITSNAQPTN